MEKSDPQSVRFERKELLVYRRYCKAYNLTMSELIRIALRKMLFEEGFEDEEWYGHS